MDLIVILASSRSAQGCLCVPIGCRCFCSWIWRWRFLRLPERPPPPKPVNGREQIRPEKPGFFIICYSGAKGIMSCFQSVWSCLEVYKEKADCCITCYLEAKQSAASTASPNSRCFSLFCA